MKLEIDNPQNDFLYYQTIFTFQSSFTIQKNPTCFIFLLNALPIPNAWQPLLTIFVVLLFPEYHILVNRIIPYVAFSDWLFFSVNNMHLRLLYGFSWSFHICLKSLVFSYFLVHCKFIYISSSQLWNCSFSQGAQWNGV